MRWDLIIFRGSGMKATGLLAVMLLGAGCFDEGGDTAARDKTIETLVQGLISFGDIQSNIQTDPGAAGDALLEFMKWPIAADSLVSPPFSGAGQVMDTSMRLVPELPVPDCLAQNGEPSCEDYTTTDTCQAGPFTFSGSMSRRCSDCENPRGFCTYAWALPMLKFTSSGFNLTLQTSGSWQGSTGQITPNLSARYDLRLTGDEPARVANLTACACTVFTVVDSPTESGKPRKLVNSSFVVRATDRPLNRFDDRCARVVFDGQGNPSVENACECDNGAICRETTVEATYPPTCGNHRCEPSLLETYETCPVDCPINTSNCGNAECEIGEDAISCPADCVVLP
jgi:hypothetical protein